MNLIIGAAAGYEVDQIRNFVLSLRKVYKGKVVLVYNKSISKKICIFLFKNNINILISDINSRNAFKKRYQIYLDILKNFGDIKKLLITDVRDVYFQEDPFKNKLFSKLNFFIEDKKIENCSINSKWILRCFGKEKLDAIKNQFISCSGITMGFRVPMLKYLREMVILINKNPYFTINYYSKGWDQGIHNHLVYSKNFSFAKKHNNQSGFVATLAQSKLKNFIFKDFFYTLNNKKINIIHQYDRHIKNFRKLIKSVI